MQSPTGGGQGRTSAFSKPFQCTVWYDDSFRDTFRKRPEPGTAHDANLRVTEVGRKELCELYDVVCRGSAGIRWHDWKDNVCHMIVIVRLVCSKCNVR
jgi:hypothetical protein